MKSFQFQREMRLRPYTRRTWSRPRGLLLILSKHVYSLKTPKEMFDSLTKLFEGKNINQKKYRNSVILEEINFDQYFSKKGLGDRGR